MNKKIKRKVSMEEKALLLLIYSFLEQAYQNNHIGINKNYAKLGTDITTKIYNLYLKLRQSRKSFANFKVQEFLLKKIDNPTKYQIDIVYISILLLYFYRIASIQRIISPISVKEVKELLNAIASNDLNIYEVKIAYNFFTAIYPDFKGIADFIKNNIFEKIKNR